jgi:hypothetical protein
LEQHVNINLRLLGWTLLVLGGALIALSAWRDLPDNGNGGLFVGMCGGILTMRAYICAAVKSAREFHQQNCHASIDMGVMIGRQQEREGSGVRSLR